jgi:hypothetical protein
MDNFFALFRRYLNDKAKGNTLYDSHLEIGRTPLTDM